MRQALRRAATSYRIFILSALLLTVGTVGTTLAEFNGETTHQATVAGGWLDAPSALGTPAPSGYGASLAWTHGTHDVASQELWGTDQGTTANCTGATYATQFASGISATANSTTDDRTSTANGHYVCYQIRSVHGSWYTGANFAVVRVGLVPLTLSTTNTGNSKLDQSDTIVITYNQNVTWSGGTINVCTFTNGTILLGDATSTCGAATDTPQIGKITGLTIADVRTYPSSTVTGSGTSTLTIALGNAGGGANGRATVTGTGTFTGASQLTSSTGSAVACTISGCTPSATFSFS